jgi:GTP-binding protein HflX
LIATKAKAERALLVGVSLRESRDPWPVRDSLVELGELARSAGAQVVGSVVQRLPRPTHTYVGKGKLEQIKRRVQEHDASTVICDDELTPTQQLKLEGALEGAKVIDRTALILDVFARRARTHEGRLQVELAQHEYLLPRLAGQWSHLERLGGGIGTRGPGETQIETDRRLVRDRIQRLKRRLEDVRRHRAQYRARRVDQGVPVASLVGYTNSGKSTLLNALTGAGVAAEDRLFSTLDPVTRRVRLPSGRDLLVTDTVGFIHKQPPAVVAAFRATLEEAEESAVILHLVDITHSNAADQTVVVDAILHDLGLSDKPRVLVLNKVDRLEPIGGLESDSVVGEIVGDRSWVVPLSALRGTGLDRLLSEIDAVLSETSAAPVPVSS